MKCLKKMLKNLGWEVHETFDPNAIEIDGNGVRGRIQMVREDNMIPLADGPIVYNDFAVVTNGCVYDLYLPGTQYIGQLSVMLTPGLMEAILTEH